MSGWLKTARALPLIALGACSLAAIDVPFPDANELIAAVESKIVMPRGADPLTSYTRTYSRLSPHGEPLQDGYVHGLLERISGQPRIARWSEERVMAPFDGGCAIVTLRYDIARDVIDRIRCNGEA